MWQRVTTNPPIDFETVWLIEKGDETFFLGYVVMHNGMFSDYIEFKPINDRLYWTAVDAPPAFTDENIKD